MVIRVALIWEQFAPYHIDRIEAVGQRLAGRAEVLAIEVATASATYAWKPSGTICHARKRTLFPGERYEEIHPLRRLWRQWRAVAGCRLVFCGVGYDRPDIIALSWLLRLSGARVVLMTDSKFDDRPRRAWREWLKSMVLGSYSAAIVAGRRQAAFLHFLGFRRRPIVPGYDTVSLDRVRREAEAARPVPFASRSFICVARLVPKKNLFRLITAYARYAERDCPAPRRLVLVGSGPLDEPLRQHCRELGVEGLVEFTGFIEPDEVSRRLAGSLALVLFSTEEQWGLAVNEAVVLGIPVIATHLVGSGDALVRNLINGFIFEPDAVEGPANAMLRLAREEAVWRRMAAASAERAWLADGERFADAVATLAGQDRCAGAKVRTDRFRTILAETA